MFRIKRSTEKQVNNHFINFTERERENKRLGDRRNVHSASYCSTFSCYHDSASFSPSLSHTHTHTRTSARVITHGNTHGLRHAAKQSSAYPGMAGPVPSEARGEAARRADRYRQKTHTQKWKRPPTSVAGSSSCKATYWKGEFMNSTSLPQATDTVNMCSIFLCFISDRFIFHRHFPPESMYTYAEKRKVF